MLRRVHAALFEEDAGLGIELAVVARNNNGTESARFDYDSTVLPPDIVHGHPGCRFVVRPNLRGFRVLVVFDPGAPATARYDLHQVNSAGALMPVGKSVTKSAATPLIGFSLDGVAAALVAGAPPPPPPPAASRAPRRIAKAAGTAAKKRARKTATKTAKRAARTTAKKAPKKSARKRTAGSRKSR
jgi:hypothetical protein